MGKPKDIEIEDGKPFAEQADRIKSEIAEQMAADDEPEFDAEIASETLVRDLTGALLDRIKHLPKPWQQMSYLEQSDMILSLTDAVKDFTRKAVRIIATEGRITLMANLEQAVVKDGIKATLTLSKHDPNRYDLMDAVGKEVLIVVSDVSGHTEGAHDIAPDAPKDSQSDLFTAGGGVDDDRPVFDNTRAAAQ